MTSGRSKSQKVNISLISDVFPVLSREKLLLSDLDGGIATLVRFEERQLQIRTVWYKIPVCMVKTRVGTFKPWNRSTNLDLVFVFGR